MINNPAKRDPVLVPHWIIKQLARSKLPLNTVLNLDKLKTVCSQEDLAILLDLNQNPHPIFGVPYIGMGLLRFWADYFPEAFRKVQEVLPLYKGKCDARLYVAAAEQKPDSAPPVAAGGTTPGLDACTAFDIQEMESGLDTTSVLFVIVYPGYFGGPQSTEVQQQLRRAYLQQSYVFLNFSEIARDSVFMQYLLKL
jgi:hypothetical protein